MITRQKDFWEQVSRFELDDPDSAVRFSNRLCRENGWSTEYSLRAIHEYKKFMFLLCIADQPLTPSDQVDQVWHLHLLYTKSYWYSFCRDILKKEIHHEPTKGGKMEGDKFSNWYDRTKEFYQKIFDTQPPEDIWPSTEIRFKDVNFQRINLSQYWIIKRPL